MKMAEIERDLRHIDPRARYHMVRMQEQINSLQQDLKNAAELLVKVVDAMNQLKHVNLQLNQRWERQLRGGPDHDMVESVIPHPEDTEH